MLRTSQSLLSRTQGLSLGVETRLLRSENVETDAKTKILMILIDLNLFPSKADAEKCVPWLQRSDDIPAGQIASKTGNCKFIFFVSSDDSVLF